MLKVKEGAMTSEPWLIPFLLNVIVYGASGCLSPAGDRLQGNVSLVYNGSVSLADGNTTGEYKVNEESERIFIDLQNVNHVTEVKVEGERVNSVNYSVDGVDWNESIEGREEKTNSSGFLARFVNINVTGHENGSVEVMGCSLDHFTLITGTLQLGNTEWSQSNKTILVTRDILIGPNSSLTLNPGVNVTFNVNAGITVQGLLVANGTAEHPISFKGFLYKKWPGITVFNGASYMNHVNMVNGTSLQTPSNATSFNVTINNSEIDVDNIELNATAVSVGITSSNMTFNSIKFVIANQTSKIEEGTSNISNTSRVRYQINISSSILSGRSSAVSPNSSVAIHIDKRAPDHSLVLQDSTITGAEHWLNISSRSDNFNLTIRQNRVRTGVSIEGSFEVVDVGANHFQTSSRLLVDLGERIWRGRDNNLLASHRFASLGLDWRQEKIYRTNNVSIKVSVVKNNFTGSEFRVTCPYRLTKTVNISGNEFRRTVFHLGTPDVVIKKNKFIWRTPQVVYRGTTYQYHEIDARENFWGCRSTAAIERKILDYKQNTNLPRIDYMPYFKDINMTELEYNTSFIACTGNRLGGHIGRRVVLSRDSSPYTAVSDIYVGKGDSMKIEPGVKIRFKKGVAFTVDGSLLMKGSPTHPIELVPETEGREWKGLMLGPRKRPRIRLVGGSDDREGTVLVWSRTRYAPMCFSDGGFNQSHAEVICRMAGFDPAGGVSIGPLQTFSGGNTEYVRYSFGRELECSGAEPDLINCKGDNSYCSYSYGFPDKPFVRCRGDRIVDNVEAPSNVMQLTNVIVKGTLDGIHLAGNVSIFDNITSKHSKSAGVTFDPQFKGEHLPEVRNLTSSFNREGVVFESDKAYRNITFKACNISSNERNAFRLSGYPSVLIKDTVVNDNRVGIYSDHHDDLNVTVDSSTFSNLRHAVYLGSRESVPLYLWSTVYRSNLTLTMTNSTVTDQRTHRRPWLLDRCTVCVRSTNGSVILQGNNFRNLNMENIISLRHRSSRFVIEDNVFTNISGEDVVKIDSIYFYDTPYPPLTNATGSVQRNVFRNNSGTSVLAVNLAENYRTRISENTLKDNNVTYALFVDAGQVSLTNNTLMNPLTSCEISSPQQSDASLARTENHFELSNTSVSLRKDCSKYSGECSFCLSRDQLEGR